MKRPCPVSRRRSSSLPFILTRRIPEQSCRTRERQNRVYANGTDGKTRASVLNSGHGHASLAPPHRRLARARGHGAQCVLAAACRREAERTGGCSRDLQRPPPPALRRPGSPPSSPQRPSPLSFHPLPAPPPAPRGAFPRHSHSAR